MADGFLGRWSRRKQEVREGKPLQDAAPAPSAAPAAAGATQAAGQQPPPKAAAAAPTAAPQPAPAQEAPPPPTLADAQALTPESDFKPFVARAVSPEVRNLAMKKLFADPHFNVMDGLDIYIGDYTQPDPLPAGALRKMVSAHALGFFDHEKNPGGQGASDASVAAQPPAAAQGDGQAIPPATAQPREDAHAATPAGMAQSRPHTADSGTPPSEPTLAAPRPEGPAAATASQTQHDHDADLRLQPDHAPRREGAGHGSA